MVISPAAEKSLPQSRTRWGEVVACGLHKAALVSRSALECLNQIVTLIEGIVSETHDQIAVLPVETLDKV